MQRTDLPMPRVNHRLGLALAGACALALALVLAACGSRDVSLDGEPADAAVVDGRGVDALPGPDATAEADATRLDAGGCATGEPQCANGCDDDLDGKTDGADPECTGGIDDDEGSFATGMPPGTTWTPSSRTASSTGTAAGNDGCNLHVCCLLDDPPAPRPITARRSIPRRAPASARAASTRARRWSRPAATASAAARCATAPAAPTST